MGSKGHPKSVLERPLLRRVMTQVFTLVQQLVLGLPTRDTQGTVFVPRKWALTVLPKMQEGGFLFSTELLLSAQLWGRQVVEVPITLRHDPADRPTTIRPRTVLAMLTGLWTLAQRRDHLGPVAGTASRAVISRARTRLALRSVLLAVYLWACSWIVPRPWLPPLSLGRGDHTVLAPVGINSADPDAFAGDWFMINAPQPHWFFDNVVAFGRATDQLDATLFGFFAVGALAFGYATALLAQTWAPRMPLLAGLFVTTVAHLAPTYFAGTATIGVLIAVPAVVAANLLYLYITVSLLGYRWAPVLLLAIMTIHVQIGFIALGVGILMLLANAGARFRGHQGGRMDLGANILVILASALLGAWALSLRQVASNPSDFMQICERFIPFHCFPRSWTLWELAVVPFGSLAACAPALLISTQRTRKLYLIITGSLALTLITGVFLALIPTAGIAQFLIGNNIFRLGAAVFPFTIWALLTPFLRSRWSPKSLLLSAVLLGTWALLLSQSGTVLSQRIPHFHSEKRSLLLLMVVLAGSWLLGVWAAKHKPSGTSGRWGVVVALVAFLALTPRGEASWDPDQGATWLGSPAKQWGEQARRVIPVGSTVLIDPAMARLRLPLERAILVDCKDIPYGGAAYREWIDRLNHLGGWQQCRYVDREPLFSKLSGAELDAAVQHYRLDAVVLTLPQGEEQVRTLTGLGYIAHRLAVGNLDTVVLLPR